MSEAALPASYLERYLEPFREIINREDIVEIAINPDGRIWIERQGAAAMEPTGEVIQPDAVMNLATALVGDEKGQSVREIAAGHR